MTRFAVRNSTPRENTPWVQRYADELAGSSSVLDLGCGVGHDLLDLVERDLVVTGLDIDVRRVGAIPFDEHIQGLVVGDIAHGIPFVDASFDTVLASLSLHYFDCQATHRIIEDVARILSPGGLLLCRVNAVGDRNFGYGAGTEVEPEFFLQPDGRLKRFFTPASLERFLAPCFTVERIAARVILQNGQAKRTLECLARRR